MKKFLLFAVATLFAGSLAAQKADLVKTTKAYRPAAMQSEMKTMLNTPLSFSSSALSTRPVKERAGHTLNMKQAVPTQAALRLGAQSAPRKEAALQASYNGRGINYQTKEPAAWVMQSAQAEDGTPLLVDVIPLPESWAALEYVAVDYTQDGNTITIQPQKVAQNSSYFFYIHSWASADGAIVFTIGDDGSLTTIDGEDIAYSAFTEDYFDLSEGGPYAGLVLDIEKVKYYMEGQKVIPVAGYEPEPLFLHPGPNVDANYYTNLMIPAYDDIKLKNRTVEADTYEWSIQQQQYNSELGAFEPLGDPITSDATDFVFSAGAGVYEPATLTATLLGEPSESFAWNPASWYAGGQAADWISDETTPTYTMTKANPQGDLTYINPNGVSGIIIYQGKPGKGLSFSGVSLFVYQFNQDRSVNFEMPCKIYKVQRDSETGALVMGDLIAQSDVDVRNIERGSWMSSNNLVRLHWDSFYTEDEMGLTEDVELITLDDEFAVVIEGWDNGSFSGYPLCFTSVNNAGVTSTYAIVSGEEEYSGRGWWSFFGNVFLGLTDATFGYLHTEDATEIELPVEGGEATLHVDPMFYSNGDEGPQTALWLESITVDGELQEELPEWIELGYTNPEGDGIDFDLSVAVEALPEGVEGRVVEIALAQWGAILRLNIKQGKVGDEPVFEPIPFAGEDGKYFLVNLESEKCWGAGNSWGTQASLVEHPEFVTLLKQPDGTYFLESQVSNGGTNYYFGGDYMDGQPVPLTITAVAEADADDTDAPLYLYTISQDGNYFGWDGETTVLGKNLDASSDNALWAIISWDDAVAALATATEDDPIDATYLIQDPNFGRNNRYQSAWTMDANNQNLSGGNNINNCAESWQSAFTLSQKVSVPTGKYIVTAQAALTDYTNAYDGADYPVVYANDATAPFNNMDEDDRGTSMSKLSESFSAGKYLVTLDPITVIDGNLTIGVKGTRTNTWCIWDNFTLTYLGPVEIDVTEFVALYEKALAAAQAAAEQQMSQAAKAALDKAIADYSNVDKTSVAALQEATKALNAAVEAAQTSIKSYEILAAGVVADNSLENWTCTNANTFHINTWSVEGNEGNDPSGMVTPFIENWVGKPGPLGEGQVFYTLAGIDPGQYSAEALVRVYSESGSEPAGATFFVGDDKTDIGTKGNNFEYNGMLGIYGVFGGTATVGDDGVLKFGVDIAAPTFNWVAIKNVKIGTGAWENGITSVNRDRQDSNVIFNLNGQKVQNAQKGLYIIGGKKVVVK